MKKYLTMVMLFGIAQLFAQKTYCPPIVEVSSAPPPVSYSFKEAPKVQKVYPQEYCKAKHPKYTGELYLYSTPDPYVETVKEIRMTAVLDGCGNILEVLKVDTIEVGQSTTCTPTLGNYWTIRVEYLKTPAKHRPEGFMVSQLPDGNWITHWGNYTSAAAAKKELGTLLSMYPQWCKMYVFQLPYVTHQGMYYEKKLAIR